MLVLLQECHLPSEALKAARRNVHQWLPGYSLFTNRKRGPRDTGKILTITLIHYYMSARASLLDITDQLHPLETAPDAGNHLHFLRILEPRTGVSLLVGNIYQYQASQPQQQAKLLEIVDKVTSRWKATSDHIILAGDWNASTSPRVGYSENTYIRQADERLLAWSRAAALTCAAPPGYTWSSYNESRRAVLDCFFHSEATGLTEVMAFYNIDPRHDHAGVKAAISIKGIEAMPPLEALRRPVRLNMKQWKEKRALWQEAVVRALPPAAPDNIEDPFQQLEHTKKVCMALARSILGTTGGKLRSPIPHHSSGYIKLTSRLNLLKVVRREIHARKEALHASPPSKAMKKVWDSGLYPRPAPDTGISDLWSTHTSEWTDRWLRHLRHLSAESIEELEELRKLEIRFAAENQRSEAIDRFFAGGELRRILRPRPPQLHTPQLIASQPSIVFVTCLPEHTNRLASILHHVDCIVDQLPLQICAKISAISPSLLPRIIELVNKASFQIRGLSADSKIVTQPEDRLGAWEQILASEAAASKAVCQTCRGKSMLPISLVKNGDREMATWCTHCCSYTRVEVHNQDYADMPFSTESIPRIPAGSGASLRGPINREDLDYFLGQLPNNKAPMPEGPPYELLKDAPEPVKEAILDCINAILREQGRPPAYWLGGFIRFLHKKGDTLDVTNYRPVCLLDTVYKILSAILTDRLYRMCERYGLLDSSQEGFRKLHSTQRQIQSLHWSIQDAAGRGDRLYLCYLDFDNAFNSVDHEALWRWLRELNVPDLDLLQSLYDGAHYVADLPYGRSAPIFLARGMKQGDKLSPLLFSLFFNALLLALKATGIGHNTITGLRTSSRGFADDLALTTGSATGMSRLLSVTSSFCAWSGMRVKLPKSFITAFDFRAKKELLTQEILYNGATLVHLPADESFPYLGVRASLIPKRKNGTRPRVGSSPALSTQKAHVLKSTKELTQITREHSKQYLLSQIVPAMHAVATARFRYCAPLIPWTDAELDQVHRCWLQVHRASWRLPPGYPSSPLQLPSDHGGTPVAHPRVILIQALAKHVEQLVALPDEIRASTIERYRKLCTACGCHNPRELATALAAESKPRQCPIARLMRACGQLQVQIRLPACLTIGKEERETSWFSLLTHLQQRANTPEATDRFKLDLAVVTSAWPSIRRHYRRRGIRAPRQLVRDPRAPTAWWSLEGTNKRKATWLEPLERTLQHANTTLLFPRLNRAVGAPETPTHQILIHDVLIALDNPCLDTTALFGDERWNLVHTSVPWRAWLNHLGRLGLTSSFREDHPPQRKTGPIHDLVALGQSGETNISLLRDLCSYLAPTLHTTMQAKDHVSGPDEDHPLQLAPVLLTRELVEFHTADTSARTTHAGPYCITTSEGLTRIKKDGNHVATITQGRWALLTAAYDLEVDSDELCRVLPAWTAALELQEQTRGVPSAQFWQGIKRVTGSKCIIGSHPLVAPSSFEQAFWTLGGREGWGHAQAPEVEGVTFNLLTMSHQDQQQICNRLYQDRSWWALTRRSTLSKASQRRLQETGQLVTVFRRGLCAAAAKGSWRTGKLKTTQTNEGWALWATQKAIDSHNGLNNLKYTLANLRLTADGTIFSDPHCPSFREVLLGPAGAAYSMGGIVAATDGSLKKDGSMGAAFVSQNNRMPARSVAVFGSRSSLRPELTGITLALEDCPQNVDLNILTDSLSSIRLLQSLQRADFPLSLYRHPVRHLVTHVVLLINRRTEAGSCTRFFKVKSHRGEPLNEAADALASAAAELDPVEPLSLDPQAVYFYYCNQAVEWNARLRKHLTQRAAHQQAAKLLQPHSRPTGQIGDAEAPPPSRKIPLTTSWLLRAGQGRRTLGQVLANMKMNADKRRILQSIATFFPANAVLHRWKIIPSPSCNLCPSLCETQTHIQCVCPALKEMRIRAHHTLAGMLWDRITHKGTPFCIHREVTVDGLRGLPAPMDRLDDWQRCMDCLIDNDLDVDAEAGDPPQLGGLLRKRPDAVAIHWGQATAYILEFTRPSDSRIDWHTTNDLYKRERYTPLMTKMRTHLTHEWTVEILCFTLGVRGSYHEDQWTRNLTALGYPADSIPLLMTDLVSAALTQLNEVYKCRSSALQSHARQAHR